MEQKDGMDKEKDKIKLVKMKYKEQKKKPKEKTETYLCHKWNGKEILKIKNEMKGRKGERENRTKGWNGRKNRKIS